MTATRAPSTWRPVAVPRSCQTHSQTWAIAWAGIASPKQERPPEGLTGTRPPRRGGAVTQQLLGLTLAAQADVLVPVELERGREVVDLGEADVLGTDPGLRVGRRGDGRPEARGAAALASAFVAAAESVEKFGISMTVLGKVGRDGGDGVDGDERLRPAGVAPGEVDGGEDEGRPAVGGGADLEEAQRVRHHGRGEDLVDGDLLAVARA